MSFISSHFFLFLAITIFFFYLFPKRFQSYILLTASIFFYLFFSPLYTVVLVILVLADFIIAKKIKADAGNKYRKKLMISGLLLNIVFLVFFKFYYQFEKILASFFTSLNLWDMKYFVEIAVPLGISYFIFKKISYLVDVYRGIIEPEKDFSKLLLYVMFFPEIVAGPIDRTHDLISQFSGNIRFNTKMIQSGFQRILWGIFKKVIIADRISIYVDTLFKSYRNYEGSAILLTVFLYSIQIYCDFSAIADIAIGIGKMFGINIKENFNKPYFAVSVSDFWKRWHITLSTWLRDYIFLPFAYIVSGKLINRNIKAGKSDNITYIFASMTTMMLCGLWHGSEWTFIIWGAIHGFYLIFSHITKKMRKKIKKNLRIVKFSILNKSIKIVTTFSLITFSWIFFRSESIEHAFGMIKSIFYGNGGKLSGFSDLNNIVLKNFPHFTFEIMAISITLLFLIELLQIKVKIGEWILNRPIFIRILFYYFTIFTILIFTVKRSGDFIYMQF